MKLNELPKITDRKKKRLGRGYGSGKGGHTSGRGAKGRKARGKVGLTFEGTKFKKSFLKKLPLRRGKGKFKPFSPKPIAVNVKYLNSLPKGSEVDLGTLVKHGILREQEALRFGAKILGDGPLSVSLKVKLPTSQKAAALIKKAGGQVVVENEVSSVKPLELKSRQRKPGRPAAAKKSSQKDE